MAGGAKFGKSSWIALVLVLPAAALSGHLFRGWNVTRTELEKKTSELQTLSGRNAALSKAYEVLQNQKFQVCNKSPYPIDVTWLSAAYNDGKQIKVFDSSRCSGWTTQEVAAGENKNLLLSSSQEGCNWSGSVMYFAMRFTKETDEASLPYSVVGLYRGFDRDCYNVQ